MPKTFFLASIVLSAGVGAVCIGSFSRLLEVTEDTSQRWALKDSVYLGKYLARRDRFIQSCQSYLEAAL